MSDFQKQPAEASYKKLVFGKISENLQEKNLCQSLFFNKVASLRPADGNKTGANVKARDRCFFRYLNLKNNRMPMTPVKTDSRPSPFLITFHFWINNLMTYQT